MTRDHMMGWAPLIGAIRQIEDEYKLRRWVQHIHAQGEHDLFIMWYVQPWPLGVPSRAKQPPPSLLDDINRQAWRLDACQASTCNSAKSNSTSLQQHSATCPTCR